MGRDEFGFDDDPFADFSQQCVVSTGRPATSSKSRRGVGRVKSSDSYDGQESYGSENHNEGSRKHRSRRNEGELVLPGSGEEEGRPRRRTDRSRSGDSIDGGRSVESGFSTGSGGAPAPRTRRGRRASLVQSMSQANMSSSVEPDYGYGDTSRGAPHRTQSNDVDYGYGASAPAAGAPARRRGRRMSVGAAPPVAAPEMDYGYGDATPGKSYDEKFGRSSSTQEDDDRGERKQRSRNSRDRAVNISDIKNTDLQTGANGRDLGGNPRPANTPVVPMTLPDAQKSQRTRRRASMLGAVGAAVGGTVGAVGDLAGSVGNAVASKEGAGNRRAKGRRMSMVQVIADEEKIDPVGSDDRRRQGTMLDRFG